MPECRFNNKARVELIQKVSTKYNATSKIPINNITIINKYNATSKRIAPRRGREEIGEPCGRTRPRPHALSYLGLPN
jgi:hypothetical protein